MLKKICICIFFQILSIFAINAQIQNKQIKPVSFSYYSDINPLKNDSYIKEIIFPKLNRDSLIKLDDSVYDDNLNTPFRFGFPLDSEINLDNSGLWDTLDNGGRLWRLKIKCEDAVSINLIYNHFYLPEQSYFFIYNSTKKYILGAFTKQNNKLHNKFSTDLIPGEICYLEYYEPKNEKGKGIIEISKVIYGYIDILNYKETEILKKSMNEEILLSGSCNRNINCPEGDAFCREKYSVSRIIFGGHLCTGSLINNVLQDYSPYYLTANHCLVGDTDVWLFQFGYMHESCNGDWPLPTYSYSGADIRANWANSDFALLELQEQPQSGENNFPDVFFNGWDRSENIPDNLIALHHPNGDYMKINTDDDDLSIWSNHWLVRNWNTGTTEPGSSGSPLYNQDQRVIGQLHGQLPLNIDPFHEPCDPDKESIYGMISRSWLGAGTNATSLHHWLDPDNTGAETLDGIKMPLLKYGWIIVNGQIAQINAYSQMRIGSSNSSQFTVQNGGNLTLKAGKEIVMRPCTTIESGSEFRAHIEDLDCSDLVMLSDRESEYDASICSPQNPPIANKGANEIPVFKKKSFIKITPNPFTDDTRISISLSSPDIITLTVYDVLGNRIAVLADITELSAGTHNFNFSGHNINSGVYYVVMSSSTERISHPLMLIK